MKNAATLIASVLLGVAVVRPLAVQPAPTRLALELQDYAALPVTVFYTLHMEGRFNQRAEVSKQERS